MDTSETNQVVKHRHHGKVVAIVAGLTIPFWLLISDGYLPQLGIVGSFYHSMTLYRGEWFCRKESVPNLRSLEWETIETDCSVVRLPTKYAVSVSALVAAYGLLIFFGILPSPVDKLRALARHHKSDPKVT